MKIKPNNILQAQPKDARHKDALVLVTRRQAVLMRRIAEVMTSEGFLHLSVSDIAEKAGCGRSTLYTIAPTKEAIFLHCVNEIHNFLGTECLSVEVRNRETIDVLRDFVERALVTTPFLSKQYFMDAAATPAVQQSIDSYNELSIGRVTLLMERGIARKELRAMDAALAAECWYNNLLAFLRQEPSPEAENKRRSRVEEVMELIHAGLLNR
jgi:AcrR family transcriptional regulator